MAAAEDLPRGELEPNLRHRLPLPRWGDRRTPRRAAADRSGGDRPLAQGPFLGRRSPPAPDGSREDGGLEELRAKLMGHLRVAADRMKLAAPEPTQEVSRPWNLRARKSSNGNGHGGCASGSAPIAAAAGAAVAEEEEKKRSGLTVALTADEIEEDIYAVTGSRPRRRPKKRPRVVQRLLDNKHPEVILEDEAKSRRIGLANLSSPGCGYLISLWSLTRSRTTESTLPSPLPRPSRAIPTSPETTLPSLVPK